MAVDQVTGVDQADSNTLKLNKFNFYGAQVVPCFFPPQLAVEEGVGLASQEKPGGGGLRPLLGPCLPWG